MKFDYYIGVDQTGALDKNKKPKALCIAILENKTHKLVNTSISSFQKEPIHNALKNHFEKYNHKSKVMILVDCVIGLPQELDISLGEILEKIKNYSFNKSEYGLDTAHSFFISFLKNNSVPKRLAEDIAQAHSVFKKYPFQRNISCGSYRILKDLSQSRAWINIWPFENPFSNFVMAESYPSLCWKLILKSNTRNSKVLDYHLKNKFKLETPLRNQNERDATVLAISSPRLKRYLKRKLQLIQKKEGWILGVPF